MKTRGRGDHNAMRATIPTILMLSKEDSASDMRDQKGRLRELRGPTESTDQNELRGRRRLNGLNEERELIDKTEPKEWTNQTGQRTIAQTTKAETLLLQVSVLLELLWAPMLWRMQIEPTELIATIEMTADEASTMRSLGDGETEIEILLIWLVEIRRSGGTERMICHHHHLVHLCQETYHLHETTSRLLEFLLRRETRTSRNVAHQQPSSSTLVAAIQRNGMDPERSETATLNVVNANDVDIETRQQQHWLERLLLILAQRNPLPLTMPVQNPVV
jgi:hypothetical protein